MKMNAVKANFTLSVLTVLMIAFAATVVLAQVPNEPISDIFVPSGPSSDVDPNAGNAQSDQFDNSPSSDVDSNAGGAQTEQPETNDPSSDIDPNAGGNAADTEQTETSALTDASFLGSGSTGCSTQWQCTAWTTCTDGTQTRTCSKVRNQCQAPAQPLLTQTCTEIQPLAAPSEEIQSSEAAASESSSSESSGFSPITGAVIGTMREKAGLLIPAVFIAVVLALAITARVRRK